MNSGKGNALALLPLAVFLVIFIGTGTWLTLSGTKMAFYQVSATVAILPAIVLAVMMAREKATESIGAFIEGAGDGSIVTMCMIYLLAGAFAKVAGSVGGVESTVNFGLSIIPASMVLPGLFVIGAFISTAMGTSMGTIAAVAPIAVGVAAKTDISMALLVGAVAGGAMFGDNLSMISDTTIAATRTQGCNMQDKFKMNFGIALPAAILSILIFAFLGASGSVHHSGEYQIVKILPYLGVLGLALAGINVFIVLMTGIVLAGGVGLVMNDGYTMLKLSKDIYGGFTGMQEIMVLSLMIGGLGALIKRGGGITSILNFIERVTKGSRSQKAGELSIAALVSLVNCCTANNTVAIIVTGGVAKEIAQKNGLDPRRSASLLDIFSCVIQGLVPYGAQILLAGSIASLSPISIMSNMYYCYILAAVSILSILFGFPKVRKQ